MKVVTAKEMQEIDRRTIKECGVPGPVLMERAGVAVAERIREMFEPGKLIVLAGAGNNGGDGIVVGRELHNSGWHVKVFLLLKEDKLSPDCLAQYRIAKKVGVPIEFGTKIDRGDLHAAVVVDALFGTGLSKDIKGALADTVDLVNSTSVPIVSVDIPSGISSDDGKVMGTAIRATATVTFGAAKRGHVLYPGADHTGELFVENIGFPEEFFDDVACNLLDREEMLSIIPPRPRLSHKGDYGHVLVVAGSRGKTGSALMSARACLVSGAGLVTIGVPESLMDVYQSRVTEEMCLPLPDNGDGTLSAKAAAAIGSFVAGSADVLAMGPGIGVSDGTRAVLKKILKEVEKPIVMDADAINCLDKKSGELNKTSAPLVITPHPGEFARISGMKIDKIEDDCIEAALSFSQEAGVTLVLKGVPTVVADAEGRAFINSTGNPSMAKAGSGDVLTGMIAAFVAQGLIPADAATLGVYMHGMAGDLAAARLGLHSVLASDIIASISEAFVSLERS